VSGAERIADVLATLIFAATCLCVGFVIGRAYEARHNLD